MNQQQFIQLIGEGRHEWQWALRRKYWPEAPEAHKIFRKGFVKGKDIQSKCHSYEDVCNQGTVFYINPNEVDDLRALFLMAREAGTAGASVLRHPKSIELDAYKVAMKALNKAFVNTWADIDVDTKDQAVVNRVRSVLNHGYVEIETHGGYHFLIRLEDNPKDNWYGEARKLRNEYKDQLEIEPKIGSSFFIPMPYTLQGGKEVIITDVTL